jgi:hypothetical protein
LGAAPSAGDLDVNNFDDLDDDHVDDDNDASCQAPADRGRERHLVAAVLPILPREARLRDRGDQ